VELSLPALALRTAVAPNTPTELASDTDALATTPRYLVPSPLVPTEVASDTDTPLVPTEVASDTDTPVNTPRLDLEPATRCSRSPARTESFCSDLAVDNQSCSGRNADKAFANSDVGLSGFERLVDAEHPSNIRLCSGPDDDLYLSDIERIIDAETPMELPWCSDRDTGLYPSDIETVIDEETSSNMSLCSHLDCKEVSESLQVACCSPEHECFFFDIEGDSTLGKPAGHEPHVCLLNVEADHASNTSYREGVDLQCSCISQVMSGRCAVAGPVGNNHELALSDTMADPKCRSNYVERLVVSGKQGATVSSVTRAASCPCEDENPESGALSARSQCPSVTLSHRGCSKENVCTVPTVQEMVAAAEAAVSELIIADENAALDVALSIAAAQEALDWAEVAIATVEAEMLRDGC